MLTFINRIYKICLYAGIEHANNYQASKRIILTNALTFLYIILSIKYTFFFAWVELLNFTFFVPLTVVFFFNNNLLN